MSDIRKICMENHSHDGEVFRQELITYRKVRGDVVKERIERVFFDDGTCVDSFFSIPLTTKNL